MKGVRGTHRPFREACPSPPDNGVPSRMGAEAGRPGQRRLGEAHGGREGRRLEPGIWPSGWGMAAISDFGSEWGIVENTLSWPTECPMFSHCVQFRRTVCVPSQLVLMAGGGRKGGREREKAVLFQTQVCLLLGQDPKNTFPVKSASLQRLQHQLIKVPWK